MSYLDDYQWSRIEHMAGCLRGKNKRALVEACLYKEMENCLWSDLPDWSPPLSTVRDNHKSLMRSGILDKMKSEISTAIVATPKQQRLYSPVMEYGIERKTALQ